MIGHPVENKGNWQKNARFPVLPTHFQLVAKPVWRVDRSTCSETQFLL